MIPFFWFARPDPSHLAAGGTLALLGLAVRSWAAGYIRKDRELAVGGPYAHTRNPLYVGSLLLGTGVAVAGGRWIFVALFLLFFLLVYGRTIRAEAELLEERFGEEYRRWAEAVPLVLPRPAPWDGEAGAGDGTKGGFALRRWRKNREWEAVLGTVAGFAVLALKMVV